MKEIGLKLVYNQAEQPLVMILKYKINFYTIIFCQIVFNTLRYLQNRRMKIRHFFRQLAIFDVKFQSEGIKYRA